MAKLAKNSKALLPKLSLFRGTYIGFLSAAHQNCSDCREAVMVRLPVIVGFGGYSSAGRSSFHHAYQRMIIESLPEQERQETLADLALSLIHI